MSNICNTLKQLEAMCIKIGEMVELPLNIKIKQYNFQDSVFVCIGTSLKAEIIEMLSFIFSHWRKNHPNKDVCENVSHDQTLGSMMKRRMIHHSKNCEITACSVANIVLCKNSNNVKENYSSLYFALHFCTCTDTEPL